MSCRSLAFVAEYALRKLTIRYSLISEQGKGQPKYVRLRGQTVEEVVTKTEYTSAVRELPIVAQLAFQC